MSNSDELLPPNEPEGEYPLAPAESLPREPVWRPPAEEEPVDREDRQFSLGELLVLTTVVAMILSLLSSIARWTNWGKSPSSLAKLFGLVLGLVALLGMVVLGFIPHARRIVVVAWWILLASYIVCVVAAALMPK